MGLDAMYAGKAEMFRTAIDKLADEEIAQATEEIRAKKNAAGKAKAEHALSEALSQARAERVVYEMKFKKEISRCEFETTKAVRAHRKQIIDDFFEEIRGELVEFAKSEKYDDYLKRSLSKAESELGGNFVVLAAAKDIEKVKQLTSHEVRVDNTIMIGGIGALNEEKGLFADHTLDNALSSEKEAFTDKPELRL